MLEHALAASRADGCVIIGRRRAIANIRWANNTVTTNGLSEEVSLSVISVVGRRVAAVTRTYVPHERVEAIVRESEAQCASKPEAADYMPLVEECSPSPDWSAPPAPGGIGVFAPFTPQLADLFRRAGGRGLATFGYAEHVLSSVWLASSTGLRRRHDDSMGKVEFTVKTPDFTRSAWAGAATADFRDVAAAQLFDTLEERLAWSSRQITLPAGSYEVLLEPSPVADLALVAYGFMMRRDADEGRSPYSKPAGGNRIGERIFGDVSIYSDPEEPGIGVAPFDVSAESGSHASVFDNGLALRRTDWVRDGVLNALVTPRYWAAKAGPPPAAPYIDNLVVRGPAHTPPETPATKTAPATIDTMIRESERALLVTCFWYIRTVDPQQALVTGLTRDGVYLVENGKVQGAVNNFRWNMSPIVAFQHASQIGRTVMALPREHDEFLRAKAPPMRIAQFNMSSVSGAT